MKALIFSLVILLTFVSTHATQKKQNAEKNPPNIVFIVADDLGYSDVGYRNEYFFTPNLDQLAADGVIFSQSYSQHVCTPSRTAYMTGLYAFRTGQQHAVILPDRPHCVPLELKMLPEYMKDLNYATHLVGKWHLGQCSWNCTPTYRGFDSFYGNYNGRLDYFQHTIFGYKDLRDNKVPVTDQVGKYATTLLSEKAVDVINNHDVSKPLFLYMAHLAPHEPIQVTAEYENLCARIQDAGRRKYCGMVASLDESVGNLTSALKSKNMYDNTIIIFVSDNGGERVVSRGGKGYNYPLRGEKITLFEGGTRTIGFAHSPLLTKTGYTHDGMIHATDWFSTIIGLGGGTAPANVDGFDQSQLILNGDVSNRTEFVYNINNFTSGPLRAAIRCGDYKLLVGNPAFFYPESDDWFIPPEFTQDDANGCGKELKRKRRSTTTDLLFNLAEDPEERVNLISEKPEVTKRMRERLNQYVMEMVPANFPPVSPASNPENFNGVWSPGWC